jgi:hypothetical protein
LIDAVIDTQGNVVEMRTVSGLPILALAAMEALRHWKYEPTILGGEAFPVELLVTLPSFQVTCAYRKVYPARMLLKSATSKKVKRRPPCTSLRMSQCYIALKVMGGVFGRHSKTLQNMGLQDLHTAHWHSLKAERACSY